MVVELLVIAGVAILGYVWVRRNPESAERLLHGVLLTRLVLFGAFVILLALVLVFTGIWWLIFLGAALLLLIWLYVLIFEPHRDLWEVIDSWI